VKHFLLESQCVIYDSDELNARIIGIEYIVPESVFKTFDVQEKRYWHSHKYEVGWAIIPLLEIQS
jgi:hypothetical protein